MERNLAQPIGLREWARKIAKIYNIEPYTVIQIYATLDGKKLRDQVECVCRERAERFFKLYFDAIRKEDNNGTE